LHLETERLLLRMPRLEDVDAYLPIAADEETMRFIGGVMDRAGVEQAVHLWLARWQANGFGHLIAERREDGCLLGRTALHVWDTRTWEISTAPLAGEHGQVELGWTFAREHWGHGYATEAARAVRAWGYSLGVESIISLIHPENARSARVAAKLGATPTQAIEVMSTPATVWVHPR
jgi:RimJ/RimL family protein N-acetyltransferase